MKDYYIFQNCKLEADEHILRIEGEKMRRLPVDEIAGLHLMSGYTLTSGVIDLAAKHNIPIHAYNYYGKYHGTFFPPPVEPTGSILISQVKSRLDEMQRLLIAHQILKHSNYSSHSLLEPFGIKMNLEIKGMSVEELMLSEGRFRKEYYAVLDTILSPYWSIVTRERNPPRRPADAVLGFANGILYAKTAGWIHRAGLDPRISYIHGESRAKNPLALDLAEIFKPILSESILLEISASGSERSMITSVGEGVYLNEKGRKFVIQTIEEKIKQSVKPVNRTRKDTIENWGMSIPRKLHRSLISSEVPDFAQLPCTLSSSTIQTLKSGRSSVPY